MTKLKEILTQPLTMAKFVSKNDLTQRALAERKTAADAIEVVDALVLCVEAELEHLERTQGMTEKLGTLRELANSLKLATTVEANTPAQAA